MAYPHTLQPPAAGRGARAREAALKQGELRAPLSGARHLASSQKRITAGHRLAPLSVGHPDTSRPLQQHSRASAWISAPPYQVDVLVENFRPGVREGWGLGPADLKPELIYTRISGYGQTGPKAKVRGRGARASERMWTDRTQGQGEVSCTGRWCARKNVAIQDCSQGISG